MSNIQKQHKISPAIAWLTIQKFIIFYCPLDGEHTKNTDLGRLMHDFHCTKAEDMYSKVLAERVRVLKETQEGVEIMCKEMDKIYKAGELIGEERGKEKGKYETAMKLLELGAREDMIAEAVGHSVEEIKRWKNDMKRQ